jgi:hypothetical protein
MKWRERGAILTRVGMASIGFAVAIAVIAPQKIMPIVGGTLFAFGTLSVMLGGAIYWFSRP